VREVFIIIEKKWCKVSVQCKILITDYANTGKILPLK